MAKVQVTEETSAKASQSATSGAGEPQFSQQVLPYLTHLNKLQGAAVEKLQRDVEQAQHRYALEALADAFDLGFKTALEEAVRNPTILDRYRIQPKVGG